MRSLDALDDRATPENSHDSSLSNFDFWPHKGTSEWVQYDFKQPRTIGSSEVYWFDDTGHGECRVPKSWQLLYKDSDDWKPVENASAYDVKLDQFNRVTFKPVTTSSLRLQVQLPEKFSTGIFRWRVTN